MPKRKLPKALCAALFKHRIDPKRHPAADIIKKFKLGQQNGFYRAMYHAVMQEV